MPKKPYPPQVKKLPILRENVIGERSHSNVEQYCAIKFAAFQMRVSKFAQPIYEP